MQKVKITAITAVGVVEDIGAEASKTMSPGSRHRYRRTISYTLQDGRAIEGTVRGMTKPKMEQRLADYRHFIARGAMWADYDDAGTYQGISLG